MKIHSDASDFLKQSCKELGLSKSEVMKIALAAKRRDGRTLICRQHVEEAIQIIQSGGIRNCFIAAQKLVASTAGKPASIEHHNAQVELIKIDALDSILWFGYEGAWLRYLNRVDMEYIRHQNAQK